MNNIKGGQLIKNTNGDEYIVLDTKGMYSLLENTQKAYTPFVVAYNLQEYEDGFSWGQGHYLETQLQATELFVDKTM